MRGHVTKPGSLAAIVATVLMFTPGVAFGQDEASSADEADSPEAAVVQPAPPSAQADQMRRGQMQGQQGRGQGMQAGARLTERERLEQMREHMVAGMRRMATRLAAVQQRILALDRGEPDSAPPVEMGRGMRSGGGQGMQMQGQGMQMRDGSGPGCVQSQPPTGDDGDASSEGSDR